MNFYSRETEEFAFYLETKEIVFWAYSKEAQSINVFVKGFPDVLHFSGDKAKAIYKYLLERFPLPPAPVSILPSDYFTREAKPKKKRSAPLKASKPTVDDDSAGLDAQG